MTRNKEEWICDTCKKKIEKLGGFHGIRLQCKKCYEEEGLTDEDILEAEENFEEYCRDQGLGEFI